MGDVAALITAIAGLVTALTGLVGAIVLGVRVSRRERPRAARGVAEQLEQIAKAAEDGVITVDELRQIAEEDKP